MTVAEQTPSSAYTANGVAVDFSFEWLCLSTEDLHVKVDGVLKSISVDYTVSGIGVGEGGVVSFLTPPAAGALIQVYRDSKLERDTDYQDNGDLLADTVNLDFDRIWLALQEFIAGSKQLGNTLRVPESSPPLPSFPEMVARANRLMAFNAAGEPTVAVPSDQSAAALALLLASYSLSTQGAGAVGFNPALTYAPNTVGAELKSVRGGGTFELYVSTSGSDANDGSIAAPFATLQRAFDALMGAGVVYTATIHLAAGAYDTVDNRTALLGPANEIEAGDPNVDPYASDGVLAVSSIVIAGPDVGYDPTTNPWPTPTAVFDGGGAAVTGIRFEGRGVKALVKNVKFVGYNGSQNSAGISNDAGALRTENVHASGCSIGIDSHKGLLEVVGGDIYGSPSKVGTGIRSIFRAYHSIGDQSAVGALRGPRMRYLGVGFHAQEGSTGHSDSVAYEDCVAGILATVNARVNYSYSNFKRCSRAVRVEYNSVIFGYTTAQFNHFPSPDANTEDVSVQSGGIDVDRDAYSNGCFATDYLTSPVTVTGTLTNVTVLSKTLKAARFAPTISSIRKPQHIEGKAFGTINATTNGVAQFKFRMDSSVSAGFSLPAGQAAADFVIDFSIVFTAYNVQLLSMRMSIHNRVAIADVAQDSINLTLADWQLVLQLQLTDASDSVTFKHVHFKTVG